MEQSTNQINENNLQNENKENQNDNTQIKQSVLAQSDSRHNIDSKKNVKQIQYPDKQLFKDSEIKNYMLQLLEGVKYLHHNKIMHRDLKPDNILLSENQQIVISDFGLATEINLQRYLLFSVGTPGYVAPEIFTATYKNKYNEQCDIFSLGIIFYKLLFGNSPFESENAEGFIQKNQQCKINFKQDKYQKINNEKAINLLSKMLQKYPSQRIKIHEILKHDYFKDQQNSPTKKDSKLYINLESHQNSTQQQTTLNNNINNKSRNYDQINSLSQQLIKNIKIKELANIDIKKHKIKNKILKKQLQQMGHEFQMNSTIFMKNSDSNKNIYNSQQMISTKSIQLQTFQTLKSFVQSPRKTFNPYTQSKFIKESSIFSYSSKQNTKAIQQFQNQKSQSSFSYEDNFQGYMKDSKNIAHTLNKRSSNKDIVSIESPSNRKLRHIQTYAPVQTTLQCDDIIELFNDDEQIENSPNIPNFNTHKKNQINGSILQNSIQQEKSVTYENPDFICMKISNKCDQTIQEQISNKQVFPAIEIQDQYNDQNQQIIKIQDQNIKNKDIIYNPIQGLQNKIKSKKRQMSQQPKINQEYLNKTLNKSYSLSNQSEQNEKDYNNDENDNQIQNNQDHFISIQYNENQNSVQQQNNDDNQSNQKIQQKNNVKKTKTNKNFSKNIHNRNISIDKNEINIDLQSSKPKKKKNQQFQIQEINE